MGEGVSPPVQSIGFIVNFEFVINYTTISGFSMFG